MQSVILSGKSASNMQLIVELAKKLNIDARPLTAKQIEEREDRNLLRMMEEDMKSDFVDTDEMLREMGLQ